MYDKSVEQLKNIPLFAFVEEQDLELIAEKLVPETFLPDSTIINEGDKGDCLYLIKKGRVKVMSATTDKKESVVLSYLESGDHFGEMSLLTGEPRSASVVAVNDVELWRLSKDDFDRLILNNPNITITLTHLLSQRLKDANVARRDTEEYYKKRFNPSGSLQETHVIKILKYVEDNALSGKLIFEKDDEKATFHYKKGALISVDYGDKDEDEAMDEILQWAEGRYRVEPSLFEPITASGRPDSDLENKQDKSRAAIQHYLLEKIEEFVQFAGAKNTQRALNKAWHKFDPIFAELENFGIKALPETEVDLSTIHKWNEKYTLILAVLMRELAHALERETVGISFWSVQSADETINDILNDLQFFEFYEEAMDMVRG